MALYQNRHFAGIRVPVDGNQYMGCTFERCKIVFSATAPVSFDRCTFDNCDWTFDGPAETMLLFLSALSRGLGEGGEDLVEGIFNSVRTGTIEDGVLAAPVLATR